MILKPNPYNKEDRILLELEYDKPILTTKNLNEKAEFWKDYFWSFKIAFELSEDQKYLIKKNLKLHKSPYKNKL